MTSYMNSLALALEKGCTTIAFAAINTRAYGYPPELSAPVVIKAINQILGRIRSLRGCSTSATASCK